jgi:hypothetical protein
MSQLRAKLMLAVLTCAVVGIPAVGQEPKPPNLPTPSVKADVIPDDNLAEKFSPPGAGFSVLLPGKPKAEVQDLDTEIGKITNHVYLVDAPGVFYGVMYAEFPAPITDPEIAKGMFDNARKMAVAAVRGEVKSETEITLSGYPGRELLVLMPGGLGLLRARMYMVKQFFYQAITLRASEKNAELLKLRETEVKKFLDSFTLVADRSSEN